jgi:hypothetical protein
MRSIPSQEGVGTTIGMGTAEGAEVSYARGILSDAGMEEGTDYEFLPVGDGGPATAAFEGGEIVAYSAAIPDMAILYLEACDTTGMAGRFGSPQFVFSEAPLATMRSVMRSARARPRACQQGQHSGPGVGEDARAVPGCPRLESSDPTGSTRASPGGRRTASEHGVRHTDRQDAICAHSADEAARGKHEAPGGGGKQARGDKRDR